MKKVVSIAAAVLLIGAGAAEAAKIKPGATKLYRCDSYNLIQFEPTAFTRSGEILSIVGFGDTDGLGLVISRYERRVTVAENGQDFRLISNGGRRAVRYHDPC